MLSKNESKVLMPRLKIMMNRLWKIITVPSAILTLVFGLWLLILMPALITQTWMILKLFFIFLLVLYHIKTNLIYIDIMNDRIKYSANFFRYWNEGATLILFSIVFLATLKNSFSWVFGFVGIILLSILCSYLHSHIRKSLIWWVNSWIVWRIIWFCSYAISNCWCCIWRI